MLSNMEVNTLTLPRDAVEACHMAADIIVKHGYDPECEVCEGTRRVNLVGALRRVFRPDYPRWTTTWTSNIPMYEEALHLLDRELGGQSARLWAQAPGRTQAEVVALLRGVGA